MNQITPDSVERAVGVGNAANQIVTFYLANQRCGVPALSVHEVLRPQPITNVPLAPAEIAGTMNLRGHIVLTLNTRVRLALPPADEDAKHMCIVVDSDQEQFCLVVDRVGDVLTVDPLEIEPNPASLEPNWMAVASGVYSDNGDIIVLLDIKKLVASNS